MMNGVEACAGHVVNPADDEVHGDVHRLGDSCGDGGHAVGDGNPAGKRLHRKLGGRGRLQFIRTLRTLSPCGESPFMEPRLWLRS